MGRTVWPGYLAAGVLLTGGYYLLPSGPQAVLYVAVGVSCVAAVWFGASRNRPDRPAAWWLLGGGQLAFTAGDALFYVNELILHIEPFPSVADGFYLAGYPLVAAGLAVLIRGRAPRRDWRAVADATIIAIGFGLLSWVLVMVPYFRDPELTLPGRVFSLAYPVGDVLLALAARPAVSPGRRTVAYPLLVASLVSTMAGDCSSRCWRCPSSTPASAPPTPPTCWATCCSGRPPCTPRWPGCRSRCRSAAPGCRAGGCWR
jgi:hypothetical protein